MAGTFYGINRGEVRTQVTIAASTTGKALELFLDSGVAAPTRRESLTLGQMVLDKITQMGTYPPAADSFYGINRGETRKNITISGSSTGKQLEFRLTIAAGLTPLDVHVLGQMLIDKLIYGTYPPA